MSDVEIIRLGQKKNIRIMEASASSNQVLAEPTYDASPRTVRTNWLLFAWSQISGATKVILLVSIALSLFQIVTTIVILVIGGQQVRVSLSLPLSIYQHLFMPRRRRAPTRVRINNNAAVTIPAAAETHASTDAEHSTTTATEDLTDQENRPRPATIVSGWTERFKSLLDLFAILWFIVGNYLVFSQSSCAQVAAPYFYTTLTWILFGYTILLIPLLACASVIFCLPCVLVAMRTFNINISHVMVGGTKEEIAKIPVFKYRAPITSTTAEPAAANVDQEQQQQQPTMKKANYFRRFLKKPNEKEKDSLPKTSKYLTISKLEDAVCTICLSEYENDELVCKLWCDHHYHYSCVTEWLGLNSKCPLCKRDFRGKDFVNQDSDDEDEQV
ncbi:hypothetical protein MFLAVUS_001528 [Mucor flavus]|uniref:RING-type domain-containing protein n=1 Tax=Mucor flavus TaxID=439312 RepID=A0ABP9YMT1_9FUNG